jgi:hypothetical protein
VDYFYSYLPLVCRNYNLILERERGNAQHMCFRKAVFNGKPGEDLSMKDPNVQF